MVCLIIVTVYICASNVVPYCQYITWLINKCLSSHIPTDKQHYSLSQNHTMVEPSSSLTKLVIATGVLSFGQLTSQILSFVYYAREADNPMHIILFIIAFVVGVLATNWVGNRTTVYLLNLYLYSSVLLTGLYLLQCAFPLIVKDILFGLLTGLLYEHEKFVKIFRTMEARFCGVKLNEFVPALALFLPMPVVETLTMLWPNTKLLNIFLTVHCAVFTSMIIYQLTVRSISDYAQEIDSITEELKIEKRYILILDPETANKNKQLLELVRAERRRQALIDVGNTVFGALCFMTIPVIVLIKVLRS